MYSPLSQCYSNHFWNELKFSCANRYWIFIFVIYLTAINRIRYDWNSTFLNFMSSMYFLKQLVIVMSEEKREKKLGRKGCKERGSSVKQKYFNSLFVFLVYNLIVMCNFFIHLWKGSMWYGYALSLFIPFSIRWQYYFINHEGNL